MRRTLRIVTRTVLALVLVVGVAVGALAWRLSEGPMALGPLKPLVDWGLDRAGLPVDFAFDDAVLHWKGRAEGAEVRLQGVRVASLEGKPFAQVRELAVELSGAALLQGVVAPSSIDLIGTRLTLVRDQSGAISRQAEADDKSAESGQPLLSLLLDALQEDRAPGTRGGRLDRIGISDGTIVFDDRMRGWVLTASNAHVTLTRARRSLELDVSAGLDLGGTPRRFTAQAVLDPASEEVSARATIAQVPVAAFARLTPALQELKGIEVPIDVTLDIRMDKAGRPMSVVFDVAGGPGRLVMPELWPQPMPVASIKAKGQAAAGLSRVELTEAAIDLGGPRITVNGAVDDLTTAPRLAVEAALRDVPTDEISRYWPASIAPNPRRWITANLAKGRLTALTLTAAATAADSSFAGLVPQSVVGRLEFAGISVTYLSPLPPVEGVTGSGTLTQERLDLTLGSGHAGALKVPQGNVAVTGLSDKDQFAAVDVTIEGPLRDAMVLVDRPPLGFIKAVGLDPAAFAGEAKARLKLHIPLLDALKVDDLQVETTAHVARFTMKDAAFGKDVTGGTADLKLDAKGMEVTGRIELAEIPAEIKLTRGFQAGAQMRLEAKARLDSAGRETLGFNARPWLEGPVPVEVVYTERAGGASSAQINGDLAAAHVQVPEIGFDKKPGAAARAVATIDLQSQRVTGVRDIRLTAQGLDARGKMALADGKTVSRIDVDRLVYGATDVKGSVVLRPQAYTVTVEGPAVDLGPFLDTQDPKPPAKKDGAATPPAPKPETPPPSFDISANIARAVMGPGRQLHQVRARVERRSQTWRTIDFTARTTEGQVVRLQLGTSAEGRRVLQGEAADAGALLAVMDVTDNIEGGKLRITGDTRMNEPGRPLVGRMEIEGFTLKEAPTLARILNLLSFSGILEALNGSTGLTFDRLVTDFALAEPKLTIRELRAHGGAVGFTAEGTIDIDREVVDVSGTLVPAYAVNSLISYVPIIGQIFAGPKGSGVFAATYRIRGSFDDPEVSVNPLSTLAPGFLRNLFGIFEGGTAPGGTDPRPPVGETPGLDPNETRP